MKFALAGVPLMLAVAFFADTGTARSEDLDCLKKMESTATQARRRVNVYTGEMKNMTDNPSAKSSISVCNGSLSRAEQFYKKESDGKSICTGGSTYVDSQTAHLFKNATITCRSELTHLLQRMPLEEQTLITQRVAKKEAEIR